MKKKILAGIGLATVVGLIIYVVRRSKDSRSKTKRMLEDIAEHGYETAHDVLFPEKKKGSRKVQYGPVLPS